MRHFVFDLDGTLWDTRPLVQEAYQLAGVQMPPGAWGAPWTSWCNPLAHTKKVHIYHKLLRSRGEPPRLPPLEFAHELPIEAVHVLTSASHETTRYLIDMYLPGVHLLGWSQTAPQKVASLFVLTRREKDVVYIDDDPNGEYIAEAADVRFVRYDKQDLQQLMEDAWM